MKKARTLEKESDHEESGASVAQEVFSLSLLHPGGYSDVVSGDLLQLETFVPDRFLTSVSSD